MMRCSRLPQRQRQRKRKQHHQPLPQQQAPRQQFSLTIPCATADTKTTRALCTLLRSATSGIREKEISQGTVGLPKKTTIGANPYESLRAPSMEPYLRKSTAK